MPRPHVYLRLGKEELTALESFMKRVSVLIPPQLEVRRRAHAIWYLHQGYTIKQISQRYKVSERAVWSWLRSFRQEGFKGLLGKPRSGVHLTEKQLNQLRALRGITSKKPRRRSLWIYPRLAQWVSAKWGITVSAKRLSRIMK